MRTWLTVLAILAVTIFVLVLELRAQTPQKQAFAVCSGKCLKSISLSKDAELVAPLVDGRPDYKHGMLTRVVVDVDHSYERIEMRPAR